LDEGRIDKMQKIAILRGINVSGHKKIKMVDLKQLFINLGFTDVVTYIQSGNVIFDTEVSDDTKLTQMIKGAIKEHYDFEVPVIIRCHAEIKSIIKNCPFGEVDLLKNGAKVLLSMLAQTPDAENIQCLMSYVKAPEQLVIKDKNVYLFCPNGYGNSKLSNVFIENKLKMQATTRNWKTVHKLFELSVPSSN